MAEMLNVTVVVDGFREKFIWGELQPNNSWTGAMGDIISGSPIILDNVNV